MTRGSSRTAVRTQTFTESVIREMTRVANQHGAINLAQGFPDFAAPETLKRAAADAVRSDVNQYAITWGAPRLRRALAEKYRRFYGLDVDSEREITVTCGATEAMAASMLALVDPGDEIVIFEPFYENYGPDAILCGARPVFVPTRPDGGLDFEATAAAFSIRPTIPRATSPPAKSFERSPNSASSTMPSRSPTRSTSTSLMERSTSLWPRWRVCARVR